LRTFVTGLVCLFLATMALGQSNSEPVLKPRVNTPVQDLPTLTPEQQVAPDAPVITIHGLCDDPNTAAADCNTVVTRAQFEKAVQAAKPDMTKPQQKQFATRYVAALVLAHKAHELGLDHGPEFDEQLYLARLQLLARIADESIQKEAAQISDSEIEGYYKQHNSEFRTISYDKLYIPKEKQEAAAQHAASPTTESAAAATMKADSEAAMKAEADKLRARAAAGGDFTRLQQDAYDFAGVKLKAVDTRVSNVPRSGMLAQDASIFDLKPGDVSQVINDPQGFMVYKVESIQDQPLAEVRNEVVRMVQHQKLVSIGQSLQKTATEKTTYDDAYFAVPHAPSLRNPGEEPPASSPTLPPGKK
jgi:PPIC-type PPIASE domain